MLVIVAVVGAVVGTIVLIVVIKKRKDKNLRSVDHLVNSSTVCSPALIFAYSALPKVIVSKKDEKLINPDDDINIGQELEGVEDDQYSISVVENPLYADNEEPGTVSYHKDGEEDEVKV